MASSLGPAGGGGISMVGWNDGTTQIDKGMAVALKPGTTTTHLSLSIQEEVMGIQKFAAGNDHFVGVAKEDIAAGKMGHVVVLGPVKALSAGAITVGNAIEPLDASAKIDDSGGGLVGNGEVGVCLEAATAADQLVLVFVNALGWDGGMGGA